MTVNPFWFGFLIAIVSLIALAIVLTIIRERKEREENIFPNDFIGKKYRIVRDKDGVIYGELIDDEDDDKR